MSRGVWYTPIKSMGRIGTLQGARLAPLQEFGCEIGSTNDATDRPPNPPYKGGNKTSICSKHLGNSYNYRPQILQCIVSLVCLSSKATRINPCTT
jgi:hypothetical protein